STAIPEQASIAVKASLLTLTAHLPVKDERLRGGQTIYEVDRAIDVPRPADGDHEAHEQPLARRRDVYVERIVGCTRQTGSQRRIRPLLVRSAPPRGHERHLGGLSWLPGERHALHG